MELIEKERERLRERKEVKKLSD
jgi:hypothetical protein